MKIAVAQIQPVAGDIERNLAIHLHWMELAASRSVDLICFPELSLTGYEPTLAASLAFGLDDARLQVIDAFCERYKLHVGLGLPLSSPQGTQIAQIFFGPDKKRLAYAKQHLHADEQSFFVSGNHALMLKIGGERIAPAICYESLLMAKVDEALSQHASVYLASVAKSIDGVGRAQDFFSEIAKTNRLWVLMSNALGPCDNFVAAGGTAVWHPEGRASMMLGQHAVGMIIVDTCSGVIETIDSKPESESL